MASIRQLPSGNYQVQIRLKGLRPVTKSFSSKRKAALFARQVEGNSELARKPGQPVVGVLTFRQLCDRYMSQYRGRDRGTVGKLTYWCGRFW